MRGCAAGAQNRVTRRRCRTLPWRKACPLGLCGQKMGDNLAPEQQYGSDHVAQERRYGVSAPLCGDVSALLSTFSIRRSGMSHSSATTTYRPKEIQCHQKAKGMAAAYSIGDSLPFQSPPIAFLSMESGPCDAMINCCSILYATAAISSTA